MNKPAPRTGPKVTTSRLAMAALAAVLLAPGCKPSGPGATADASGKEVKSQGAKGAKGTKGAVLMNDQWVPVAPFVGHDAHMDLYVQCKEARDRAKTAGKGDLPLCYEDARVNKPTHLRIEHAEGRTGAAAMRTLQVSGGGAHFLIERNGSIRQILDLSYPPRRQGANRRGEIRVLSGNRAAHEALRDALVAAFPGLEVEVVEAAQVSAPAKPKPVTKPNAAPKPDAAKPATKPTARPSAKPAVRP